MRSGEKRSRIVVSPFPFSCSFGISLDLSSLSRLVPMQVCLACPLARLLSPMAGQREIVLHKTSALPPPRQCTPKSRHLTHVQLDWSALQPLAVRPKNSRSTAQGMTRETAAGWRQTNSLRLELELRAHGTRQNARGIQADVFCPIQVMESNPRFVCKNLARQLRPICAVR